MPLLPFRQPSRSTPASGGGGERSERIERRKASESTSRSPNAAASGRRGSPSTDRQALELRAAPVPSFRPPDPASRSHRSQDQRAGSRRSAGRAQATVAADPRRRPASWAVPDPFSAPPGGSADPLALPQAAVPAGVAVFGTDGHLLAITQERRELVCSVIGLMVKLGLVAVAAVSLVRLAGAYQQRMDRNGEIVAVLELEQARLARARERFDQLFMVAGEQQLIREQSQWIAPNRLRVVWQSPPPLTPPSSSRP